MAFTAIAADGGADRVGVIDIGSNSIRLVVYERLSRMPMPVFNEKVLCGLGRDLASTGRLHADGVALATENIDRFARLLVGMEVRAVDVLATAAVREAVDGPAFVDRLERRTGLTVRVIDGPEEARLSALGVLAGSPGADGVMGDLGGGSLELVGLDGGRIGNRRVTLPLGPFRLMSGRPSPAKAWPVVERTLAMETWLSAYRGRTFYPVGGAWRALARLHMIKSGYPLHVIHNYRVPGAELAAIARLIAQQGAASLERLPEVPRARIETLPYSALVLEGVLGALRPDAVVFSAYGLREGHLYDLLPPDEQRDDPLLCTCQAYAQRLDRFGRVEAVSGWIGPLFPDEPPPYARLREAACLLSDIAWADHPDYRAEHAFWRALRLPVAGIDHAERAFLAASLYVRYGGALDDEGVAPARAVMDKDAADRATLLGTALRFVHTITGGAFRMLDDMDLRLNRDQVVLTLRDGSAEVMGDAVQRRLRSLAKLLGREPKIATAPARRSAG